ncbi:uncharacterized protein LOC143186682 [Calliopsis andreniformis]|uniref:uncharacterized protein LOC143186682 n=1 Tax=Calliopsis andreniformis TaxID=337506 RepID=UPI003FCECDA7
MLTNTVFLANGRTIRDQNSRSIVANNATEALDRPTNKYFDTTTRKAEQLNNKAVGTDDCSENCNKNRPRALNKSLLGAPCPYQSKELCLIFSLSKIAKVEVAIPSGASLARSLQLNIFNGASKDPQNPEIHGDMKKNKGTQLRISKPINEELLQGSSQKPMKLTNVHCQAIRDIYIPEVKQNLPAFSCRSENNAFILSSARFLQDRRSSLNLKVNENIFKNVRSIQKTSTRNDFNIVPALLILNMTNNDYRVELREQA